MPTLHQSRGSKHCCQLRTGFQPIRARAAGPALWGQWTYYSNCPQRYLNRSETSRLSTLHFLDTQSTVVTTNTPSTAGMCSGYCDLDCHHLHAGFEHNHARADGPALWGRGTYYSTCPQLCMDYAHKMTPQDEGIRNGSHPLASFGGSTKDISQILAVDVLTGKSKQMAPNKQISMPPYIEDLSLGR